jgi:hypothetical protein
MIFGGCKHETFTVNLPSGYSGVVSVQCVGAETNGDRTVSIDSKTGTAQAACPAKHTQPTIVRDGLTLQPAGPVSWDKTGDGVDTDVRFTVK